MSEEASSCHRQQADAPGGGSVVLMHAEVPGSAVLLNALRGRGLSPVVVKDEPGVMVALAELAKRGVARRALVVVEPAHWGRAGELLSAVGAHHGSVYCWRFDAEVGGEPRLSQLEHSFGEAAHPGGRSIVGKIQHRRRTVDDLLVKAPGHEVSAREVVTQQELTMLLGPAPGEAG